MACGALDAIENQQHVVIVIKTMQSPLCVQSVHGQVPLQVGSFFPKLIFQSVHGVMVVLVDWI